jgi:hypothetical protein
LGILTEIMRWAGHVALMGKRRGAYNFGGEVKGRRLFGRGGHRWRDNIRINLKEVGFGGWEWIVIGKEDMFWAFVNAVMNP